MLRVYLYPQLDTGADLGVRHSPPWISCSTTAPSSRIGIPRDQHGSLATARGLGEARILHADQWNDVQIPLEAAVGRSIVEVLLVGDAPPRREAEETGEAGEAGG